LQEGGIEVKIRHESEKKVIPLDKAVEIVTEIIQDLYAGVEDNLDTVEFK